MIVDFRTVDEGWTAEADLCIVGAGPAGISLAREFIGTAVTVCLVESGGYDLEEDTQALYEGETTGLPYFDLTTTRLRFFGGTSNHWAGWSRPLNELDFEQRPWVAESGWPIGRADLQPYYERALPIIEIGPMEFEAEAWDAFDAEPPAFEPEKLLPTFWQWSPPVNFGEKFRAELEGAANVRLLLHANLVEIETDDAAAVVRSIGLRSLTGKSGRVRARVFVLACGGIENPRLLLAANSVEAAGLGNRHDLVGRYFMEHPQSQTGIIMAEGELPLVRDLIVYVRDGVPFQPAFRPSVELQTDREILNGSIRFDYVVPDSEAGSFAFREVLNGLSQGRLVDDFGEKLWSVLMDVDHVAHNVYRKVVQGKNFRFRPKYVSVACEMEQVPNPDSRVMLIDERDALGMNRVRLDWRLTELDRHTMDVVTRTFAEELGRLDLGRLKLDDWLLQESGWGDGLEGGHHHMGTTRMADDPRKGVVDRDCRVHGIENLFIAGSSVFPTGGFSSPTFTIVALSLRLADHLKSRFG